MSIETRPVSLDPLTALDAERIRETVCPPCSHALWSGCTDDLNVWDEEAEEAIIHPVNEYAEHAPELVGLIGPAGPFECAACAQMSQGNAWVYERDRIDH